MKMLFNKYRLVTIFIFAFSILFSNGIGVQDEGGGLFPGIMNLASTSKISANATCGQKAQEFYCKLSGNDGQREPQCEVCDAKSPDSSRRHPITNAIDGTSSWWQSPSLAESSENEWITITIDLRNVFQVAYVIIKSAISPRPGNWILERSLDNVIYTPWQFFAISDHECNLFYNMEATPGRPRYRSDTDIICTSYFSKPNPLEGGEIHTSLVNGRPGAGNLSEDLQKFTEARYIRIRLQKLQTLHMFQRRVSENDPSVSRSYFYSIKDINIGGRCICNGHAKDCKLLLGKQICSCLHNTCGAQCESCCPLFNQMPWSPGNITNNAVCEQCQCHRHASSCIYDAEIHKNKLSLNLKGQYEGGGVCTECQHFTTGINCEKCKPGYYRPLGILADDPQPCIPCGCQGPGVTGKCIGDDSQVNRGKPPGSCLCQKGFKGKRCDECADGYLNYPRCDPCPCNRAGSINKACEGNCICKKNVMGPRCDTCVSGTFHLDEYYELGCISCFCNGVTDKCEAARLAVYTVSEKGHWQVSDLLQRKVIAAMTSGSSISVARDDMSGFTSYFWLAPKEYLGERLTSYGQTLSIKASWVNLRGDTSGSSYRCPDVIIEGRLYRIAYGSSYYEGKNSVLFEIPLYEQGWYHFPKNVGDIPPDMPLDKYQLRKVSREEMMETLRELKILMIRAKFHTEQVESILHDVLLEYGKEGADATEATLVTEAVEKCLCPPGYTGLSCESCELGYRRVNNIIVNGKCVLCQCNGHVEKCDAFTGKCGHCLHNTIGENCEMCSAGYYGDATNGTPDDCKPCHCPLPLGENEFIPKCIYDVKTRSAQCICPRGYEGQRCERCTDGYFGNPLVRGNPCRPCNCSGNVDPLALGNCDKFTGRCLQCLGNTAGFNCERCKENHFGEPERGQCAKCECHETGSLSHTCEAKTGQCQCKSLYTGRQCNLCITGRGGVMEGCPPCRCNEQGSVTNICDPVSGQCACKPGVGGRHCDRCLEYHFGNIASGCKRCDCDKRGSSDPSCDSVTGQCPCKRNIVGRTCNACIIGYWGHSINGECQKCNCNLIGTQDGQCDDKTGLCFCLPGVGSPECDRCLPGFWGFSNKGCKPCEPCAHPGRNCDLRTGKCVCPPNTEGDKCERCSQGFWDYSADIGCRPCRCSGPGSLERQCDPRTGRCVCRQGYEGDLCNKCSFGYFGYPHCQACNCNESGTNRRSCRKDGKCQCDDNGQCQCKANVRGIMCNKCARGTFGLSNENVEGCFSCFCFRKGSVCKQAALTWSQLLHFGVRRLQVEIRSSISSSISSPSTASDVKTQIIIHPWNTREICYINLALPGDRRLKLSDEETRLNITNQLYVIPNTDSDIKIGTSLPFLAPIYWQLPQEFMKDKITSYNGFLRFRVQTEGNKRSFPEQILQSYPLVSLQGNWQLVLEYYPSASSEDGRYEVRLHEKEWRLKNSANKVTREQMMIALQNIQHILIRATHSDDFTSASLSEVTLDIAAEGTPVSSRKAFGVEQCFCPDQYTGTSCQNPNVGFYRWYKENHIQSTIIIDLVGESKPCKCNGRANICDPETGICQNCRENTSGSHCEVCATGYFGDPMKGRCKPCACPSRQQNFANTCQADPYSEYICHCREGYTGNKCERCAKGFFGNPSELGGSCNPCNCDPNGSIGNDCDNDGNCRCKPGIIGQDCSQCEPRHIVSEIGCISCEDGCVNILLDDVKNIINDVTSVDVSSHIPSPWPALNQIRNATTVLDSQLNQYESRFHVSQEMLLHFELDSLARILLRRVERLNEKAKETTLPSFQMNKEAHEIYVSLKGLRFLLQESLSYLENYSIGETPTISITAALDEAERIIRDIRMKHFKEYGEKADTELRRSKSLLNRVQLMEQSGKIVDEIAFNYAIARRRIDDLIKYVKSSKRTISQTQNVDDTLKRKMRRIRTSVEELTRLNRYSEDRNFNSSRMLKKAERNLRSAHKNLNIIIEMISDMVNKSATLSESEAELWHTNKNYEDKYVKAAEDHALNLKAQAIKLEKLFSKTRDVADGPLRAAEAYQRIVEALKSARNAAKNASEAAMQAYKKAYPGDPDDSLLRRSKNSLNVSRDLKLKGDQLQERLTHISKNLERQKNELLRTQIIISDSNVRLDGAEIKLNHQVPLDVSDGIKEALLKIGKTDGIIDNTSNSVEELYYNLTKIKSYTKRISDLDASLLYDIRDKISSIEGTAIKGERLSINLKRQSSRIEVRGSNLKEKIEAIKRKIEQTRQHASSIRVSLTTDKDGLCTRKYRPFLQPSTTNRLTLGYAINSNYRDALLLFFGSQNGSDYMAVELIDKKIQFTWDAGGGAKTIIHPLPLEINNPLATDETKWYHITINRIGNIGELSVRPAFMKNSSRRKLYYEPVTGASPAGFSRMDLQTWDLAWIGGAPERARPFLRAHDFAGCLHYLTLNGEPLGLWNFTESVGCSACNEGFELYVEDQDKTAFGFNGKGYFKGYNVIRRPRPFYSVVLSFKSLDEDALLFLSYNKEQNQYFSIGLKGGRVSFTVQFDHQTQLVLKSEKKLNNMKELIQIQADVQISLRNGIRMGKLVVGDQNHLATIKNGPDLNLTHQPFYFGGVDPEFDRQEIGKQIELRSMLGCMGSLSVLEIGKNPHTDGQYYGIDNTCSKEPHNGVGFLGQGFLEMPSKVLRKDSNFGFSFKTMESDALLMVSTFVGQDEGDLWSSLTPASTTPRIGGFPNPPDYYSVSLVEGHLDIRLFAGSEKHRIISQERFNDGKLHSFFAIKQNRKVRLFVDDQNINSTRLDKGSHIFEAPDTGGLYFGGSPTDIDVKTIVGSSKPLRGCIKDVIINNEILSFNEPVRFENAFIGRCSDLPRNIMAGMESDVKDVLSCQPPKQHTVQYGALKFGDQVESYAVIPLHKNFFRSDFDISFEFRTYYPSGLFFASFNEKMGRHNKKKMRIISVQLLNGHLHILIRTNRQEKKIILPPPTLNSGEWKKITLEKIKRKLKIYVNGVLRSKEKMRKRNRFGNKLFIGSIPFSIANNSEIQVYETFKGCFRNLIINNEKFEIPSLTRQDHIIGVGQCFASVQRGSYFPGDAYALYDDKFQVGPLLELQLEFRTWEHDGVLLSVAGPNNNTALSLELDNGAVLLSVNIGHSHPFSARVSHPNIFTLCDNRWHIIKAHYIKDSLTLKVDSYPEVYGFNGSNNLPKTLAEAPLYIGGIPETSGKGILRGRENFKGCIRNIVLNNQRKDWTDMYRLHNVLLNACPVL
ncbi:UNVERIFIED_CONTAM: hypothetical protein RMT77_006996 [Armadillidium vulgare]